MSARRDKLIHTMCHFKKRSLEIEQGGRVIAVVADPLSITSPNSYGYALSTISQIKCDIFMIIITTLLIIDYIIIYQCKIVYLRRN